MVNMETPPAVNITPELIQEAEQLELSPDVINKLVEIIFSFKENSPHIPS